MSSLFHVFFIPVQLGGLYMLWCAVVHIFYRWSTLLVVVGALFGFGAGFLMSQTHANLKD
jgi:uncharacterized membrane protein